MEAKPDFTVQDYQRLVKQLAQERGFDNETVSEVFTVLVEEVGELAKAIRKANGQKVDIASKQHDIGEEAADVFCLLLDLCNRLGVDLSTAFIDKERQNRERKWE